MRGRYGDLFFFKQKTAYVMRISDWSSDVCSSDLQRGIKRAQRRHPADQVDQRVVAGDALVGQDDVAVVAAADQDHFLFGKVAACTGVQAREDAQDVARRGRGGFVGDVGFGLVG